MRATKHSGVDWLGEVPANWSVEQLKRVFNRVRRELTPHLGIVTAFRDGQVTLRSNRRSEGFTEADDYSNYQRIEPNDLAIHAMDAFAGAIGVSDSTGMCSPVLSVCSPVADHEPRYMAYVLRIMANRGWIEALSRSIRERTSEFRWAEAGAQKVPVPPTDEQRRIADFLDRETAKIDALIAKQEQLITTLDERRGAVLRTLVTRGHREDVALKPASAPWLYGALIPAHWVEASLSTFLTLKSGSSITSESIEEEGDYPVFGGGGFRGYTDTFTNEGDFVLIGRVGALCGNIKRATGKFYASEHSLVSYPKVPLSQGWLAAILETMNLGQYSKASAQPVISVGGIGRVKAPFPPHEEQLAIDSKLQEAIASIEALSVQTAATAALLKERRQALISAAVTGKLEVGV